MSENRIPQASWSIEKLKRFCQTTSKKWAFDAWCMGHALNIACEKVPYGSWQEWLRDAVPGVSYETIQRWRRLASAVQDPTTLDGKRLNHAYEHEGIVRKTKPPHVAPDRPKPVDGSTMDANGYEIPDASGEATAANELCQRSTHALPFFVSNVISAIDDLRALPTKKERWQDVDVATMRETLAALVEQAQWALNDMPKGRKRAA